MTLTKRCEGENMMYKVQDRETGTVIEDGLTLEEARVILREFETEDRADGTYTPGFYEISEMDD